MESSKRLQLLESHLANNQTFNTNTVAPKSDDDVVIVSFARTAMTKAKKGSQKDTPPEAMLAPVLKAVLKNSGIDPKLVEDVCIGNVLQPGAGAHTSRISSFLAGLPDTSSLQGVNRQCSSGLQAVMAIANSIRARQIDIGIGGGVESMSLFSMDAIIDPNILSDDVFDNEGASNCLMNMGMTAENVAERYKISREEQDKLAAESNKKAAAAQKNGWFAKEITPYETIIKDKDGNQTKIIVDKDDGIREDTTVEGLSKLKGAFKKGGSVTAANSSQVTDGAAAVLLARRDVAKKLGLKVQGRILGFAVAGCPPEIMGIGPAVAIPPALKKAGLAIKDIDVFEINEAFASQALYSVNTLGVPREKLNPRGGAIALGHPLGCTGARQVVTLFNELERTNKKYGVISMCIGTGMGAAGVFERE
jgi:acetyl-CoA acyltransferase 1